MVVIELRSPDALTNIKMAMSSPSITVGVQLFKDETLGVGSYGKVCRATYCNCPCAAKLFHETLFDPIAIQEVQPGRKYRLPIKRFEQECEFLSTMRHPNVIQYLGTCRDADTGLLVLLMELMDDSLTHFLETSARPIPYHIQVNFCRDISLALSFLHAKNIVHRDLSGNNVLLINNVRAKVTDFGMAKLSDQNQQASRLSHTKCPGADVYMPPEAVRDKPAYSEKIDCFSFGVIIVQTLTRQFPKPGDQHEEIRINDPGISKGRTLMACVPEVERRHNHISKVDPNHPLLLIALDCLKDVDVERPSSQQLCERLTALKETAKYTESAGAAEREMQEQLQSLREQIREITESRSRLLREKEEVITTRELEIQELNRVLADQEEAIAVAQAKTREQDNTILGKDREIQHLKEQLRKREGKS